MMSERAHKARLALIESLAPGEPWTFIADNDETRAVMAAAEVGHITSRWFATNEPGRLFRVTAVHAGAVETVYLGFAKEPGGIEVSDV